MCIHMHIGFPAPTNVKATVLTPHTVDVTWNQSSGVTGYILSYTATNTNANSQNVKVNCGNSTSYCLDNLKENTIYTMTVQSININGKKSFSSKEVQVNTYKAGKYVHNMYLIIIRACHI